MSSPLEHLSENKKMYLKIFSLLEDMLQSSQFAAEKLANLELRQCLVDGEGTDAARFVHAWARA
eukprot:14159914-Heterocapsa_arctica.AAC.1